MKKPKSLSELYIPEQKIGGFQIQHEILEKGSTITVVSLRNSLFDGRKPLRYRLDQNYLQHKLVEDRAGVWMTDSLQELEQMRVLLSDFSGKVLVAGLGLGVFLLVMPLEVEEITIVEKSPEVIKMVSSYLPKHPAKIKIIEADFNEFEVSDEYDFVFLDFWQPTGEWALTKFVLPQRKRFKNKIPQERIRCWGESEMWGQVIFGLSNLPLLMQAPEWKNIDPETLKKDSLRIPFVEWYFSGEHSQEECAVWLTEFAESPYSYFI